MPANENFIRWEDVVSSDRFSELDNTQKRKVLNVWTKQNLQGTPKYDSLDEGQRSKVIKALEHKAGLSVAGYKPLKQETTSGVGYVNKIKEGDAFGIVIGLSVVLFVVIAGSFLVLKIIPQKFKKGDILGKEVISFNRRRHFVWCKKINSLIMSLFKSKKAGIAFILTGLFIPSVLYPLTERPSLLIPSNTKPSQVIGEVAKKRESIIVLKRGEQCIIKTGITGIVDVYKGGIYINYKYVVVGGIVLVFIGTGVVTLRLMENFPKAKILPPEITKKMKNEKINLQDHLEMLIRERRELLKREPKEDSLDQCLELLGDELVWAVNPQDTPQEIAVKIIQMLRGLGELENLRERLEESEEARQYDLWQLLSEYHPSSLE